MDNQFDLALIKEYAYTTGLALLSLGLIYAILYLINHFTGRLKRRVTQLKLKNLKIFRL